MSTRLQEHYKNTVIANLMQQFGYKSVMEVPRITKITLNMGLGVGVAKASLNRAFSRWV